MQSLINIINNAKDVLQEIEDDDKRFIFVDLFSEDGNAVIRIKDSGGGIPMEIKERIFEMLFTTKGENKGTGLGLHMAKKLITEKMGGSVEVKNREFVYNDRDFKGAEFTIKLPLEG
jgi:signal transduction histidine kinase